MGLILNRRREMGGGGTLYDAEVEYLESTGTQWIDTLIHPTTGYGFEIYGGFTTFRNSEFFGGGINWSSGLGICTHGGGTYGIVVGTTEVCTITATNNVMHQFRVNTDGTVYVDNEYKGQSTTAMPDGSYTMNIFRHSGTQVPLQEKIYYVKIYNSTGLLFDGVPVRIGTTGYMYDRVSKQLFGNSGTDNFVLGPDVVYHWSGEDALSGSSWIDRVGGKIWSVSGNTPTKGTNYYEVGSVPNAFFVMDMNSQGLNLGTYYDVAITFEVLTVGTATYGNFILDLGSLTSANKAFGISFSNDTRGLGDNWKGLGNNSTQYGAGAAGTVPLNQKVTIIYGCKKYSDTQDVQYFINNGMTYQSTNPHSPSVDFNGTDWNNNTGLIGDGVVGEGKCGKIRVYDIKMYRYD